MFEGSCRFDGARYTLGSAAAAAGSLPLTTQNHSVGVKGRSSNETRFSS
jgi:hypothetical protein